ncbi:metalloregulator ArsR/SmtB family transcription factor [uncultured Hoeflea sp.]|uniref:ArsR/SmtB family transcription factor n=1 Tax=uncultured Hoeflea sp. TaxID=538666 RepID=UPI00262EC98D|nr:metalloregulator ArsR/SmtB family transcription factor [uncultured Hoeflea sp.]
MAQTTISHPDLSGQDIAALAGQARKASDILKALSHETRLMILWLLSQEERSVSELEELLSLPQAAVSQQLARLRFDRLVTARRTGRTIHYSISNTEISALVANMYELLCATGEDSGNWQGGR